MSPLRAAVLGGVVVGGALGVMLLFRPSRRRAGWRTALLVVVVTAVACGGAFVPLPVLGAARTQERPQRADERDPILLLPGRAGGPADRRAFTVTLPPALRASPPDWALLAYGGYSAQHGWSAAPVLRPLRAGPDVGAARVPVLLSSDDRLLPHPVSLTGATPVLDYDGAAETLRSDAPLARYTVALAPRAARGPATAATPLRGGGDVPACARASLRPYVEAADPRLPTALQLAQVEEALARHGVLDPRAAGGAGCDALASALSRGRAGSDQYATAFALAARMLGVRSRVVVGYSPVASVRADGRQEVRAADALAWPEVAFAGLGWVDFRPFPAQRAPRLGASRPTASARPSPTPTRTDTGTDGSTRASGLLLLAVLVAAAVVAAAVWAAVDVGRRRRQRREGAERRSRLPSRRRVVEAWQSTAPAAREPWATAHDTAATGQGPLAELAVLVDRTLYDPAAVTGPEEALAAEELAASVHRRPGLLRRRPGRRT